MSSQVYIAVFFPALNKSYDFVLPREIKVSLAIRLIAKTISEQEQISLKYENLMLCNKDTKVVLDKNLMIFEVGLQEGQSLIIL